MYDSHHGMTTTPVRLFARSGIDKNTGSHWLRVEQPKDSKIVFKQVKTLPTGLYCKNTV